MTFHILFAFSYGIRIRYSHHAHAGPGFRMGLSSRMRPALLTFLSLYASSSLAFSSRVFPSRKTTVSLALGWCLKPARPRPLISMRGSFWPFETHASAAQAQSKQALFFQPMCVRKTRGGRSISSCAHKTAAKMSRSTYRQLVLIDQDLCTSRHGLLQPRAYFSDVC
jgi:hypothetical protein